MSGIRAGKSAAPESVLPANVNDARATLPFLLPPVAAMVKNPVPLRNAATGHDTSSELWLYRPSKHKNSNRGQSLIKAIPEESQDILAPFLDRPGDANRFGPREPSE